MPRRSPSPPRHGTCERPSPPPARTPNGAVPPTRRCESRPLPPVPPPPPVRREWRTTGRGRPASEVLDRHFRFGEVALVVVGVPSVYEDGTLVDQHRDPVLVEPPGPKRDDAAVGPRFRLPLVEHGRFGVQSIADKNRVGQLDPL